MPDLQRCELDRSQAIPTFDCQPVEVSSSAANVANQCLAEPNQSPAEEDET